MEKTFIKERNMSFLKTCVQLSESGHYGSVSQVVTEALKRGPREYYVDYEHAYKRLLSLRKKDTVPRETERDMFWAELLEKVQARQQQRPGLSLSAALSYVLAYQHPGRYFIEPLRALNLIKKYCRVNLVISC
ncbi:MAG: hypothetical protein K2M79_02965 [Muribaculaceae bacterium]|nr:hypothetical protein [Muribaculaceae bacterium]